MPLVRTAFTVFLLVTASVSSATADDGGPVAVELFTSQSCYSCPPAEAYLGELAQQRDVVALEYHVDYWDDLNYGRHGRWKDVWSTPEMTARQRDYNMQLRNTRSVYTPQMVVDGRTEAVGSRRSDVRKLIGAAKKKAAPGPGISVGALGAGGIVIELGAGQAQSADVWLVTFVREHTTKVVRGENHGKTLTNHNIVRSLRKVGHWDGSEAQISVRDLALKEGEGCAVLLQSDAPGPVLGAAYCPPGASSAS